MTPTEEMSPEQERIAQEAAAQIEANPDFRIEFKLATINAVCLCSILQLALRHPEAPETAAGKEARALVDLITSRIRSAGLTAVQQLIEAGNNQGNDTVSTTGRYRQALEEIAETTYDLGAAKIAHSALGTWTNTEPEPEPFKCEDCKVNFSTVGFYYSHRITVHGDPPPVEAA